MQNIKIKQAKEKPKFFLLMMFKTMNKFIKNREQKNINNFISLDLFSFAISLFRKVFSNNFEGRFLWSSEPHRMTHKNRSPERMLGTAFCWTILGRFSRGMNTSYWSLSWVAFLNNKRLRVCLIRCGGIKLFWLLILWLYCQNIWMTFDLKFIFLGYLAYYLLKSIIESSHSM